MPINAPPHSAPYPAPEFLESASTSSEDLLKLCGNATDLPCRIPVTVGLFFDGTNNHMERDREGKHVPAPFDQDELKKAKAAAADQKAPRELVWSDSLRVDIPRARAEDARQMAEP